MIRAGALKHRIKILKPTASKGELGTPIESFSPLIEDLIPAAIKSVIETEKFVSAQVRTQSELKFVIRYLANVDTSMQVEFDNKKYELLDVRRPEYSQRELHLYAKVVS